MPYQSTTSLALADPALRRLAAAFVAGRRAGDADASEDALAAFRGGCEAAGLRVPDVGCWDMVAWAVALKGRKGGA